MRALTGHGAPKPGVLIVLRGTWSILREHRWLPSRVPLMVSEPSPIVPMSDWSVVVRLRDQVREVVLHECGEPDLGR